MKRANLVQVALALLLGGVGQARAEFTITIAQDGANVEAVGSGTLNLTALTELGSGGLGALIVPNEAFVVIGNPSNTVSSDYGSVPISGPQISGPSSIDSSGFTFTPSTGSGGPIGIYGSDDRLFVPVGYVSGTEISSSSTWDNTTISGLGLTPGTYTWSWGTGANADSLEVIVLGPSPPAVPEPSTLTLFGIGAVCSLGYGWRRRRQSA